MEYTSILITFIIILFATYAPLQQYLAEKINIQSSILSTLLYATLLLFIDITLTWIFKADDTSEPFFFQVSNPQKCHGAFYGKPASFQFTQVGSGDCKPLDYPPLGMIGDVKSCQYGSSQNNHLEKGISYVNKDSNFL